MSEELLAAWQAIGPKVLEGSTATPKGLEVAAPRIAKMLRYADAILCRPTYKWNDPRADKAKDDLVNEIGIQCLSTDSFVVSINREWLVETAIRNGFKRLLFLDTDTVVQAPGVERLFESLERTGAAMVAALVPRRPAFVGERVYNANLGDDSESRPFTAADIPRSLSPVPVHFVGVAVAVLDLVKIGAAPAPRFSWQSSGMKYVGEDVLFCKWLRQHKLDFYVDPAVATEHVCPVPLSHDPEKALAAARPPKAAEPQIVLASR